MKLFKYILTVGFIIGISLNVLKADVTKYISKESDIERQYKQEIRDMLALPVFLKFEDKNLKGTAVVYVAIMDNGKINFMRAEGENKSLNEFLKSKVNSINAWTGKEFAGKTFKYTINVK